MSLIEHLEWCYATKVYREEKVSEEKIKKVLEALRLTVFSRGLQSYRVLVISDENIKKRLGEGSFNAQIAKCSHLLVFAVFNHLTPDYISEYIGMTERERDFPEGALDKFKNALLEAHEGVSKEENSQWSDKQAYIH